MAYAIDHASWHTGQDFPELLPAERGGTHIAFFLAWAIERGLARPALGAGEQEARARLLERQLAPLEFHQRFHDGCLLDADLGPEAAAFAAEYYETYLGDYCEALAPDLASPYEVEPDWKSYDRIRSVLDARIAVWRNRRRAG